MNDLSQYEQPHEIIINKDDFAGYASADDAVHNNSRASCKCRGSNNLRQYEQPHENIINKDDVVAAAPGYASADDAVDNNSRASRKCREEPHRLLLSILLKQGKGDWRGLSGAGGDADGDDDNDGDNNGGGGDKNKKKGGGSGDGGDGGDKAEGGDGEEKGMNKDCTGQLGFGYRCTYHAGYENGYPVEQLNALKMFCSENMINDFSVMPSLILV